MADAIAWKEFPLEEMLRDRPSSRAEGDSVFLPRIAGQTFLEGQVGMGGHEPDHGDLLAGPNRTVPERAKQLARSEEGEETRGNRGEIGDQHDVDAGDAVEQREQDHVEQRRALLHGQAVVVQDGSEACERVCGPVGEVVVVAARRTEKHERQQDRRGAGKKHRPLLHRDGGMYHAGL